MDRLIKFVLKKNFDVKRFRCSPVAPDARKQDYNKNGLSIDVEVVVEVRSSCTVVWES